MLQATGSDKAIVGPFFEPASLDAVLSELAKTIMQAGAQTRHAEKLTLDDYRLSLDYLTTQGELVRSFLRFKNRQNENRGDPEYH
jgi:hypothetical protein